MQIESIEIRNYRLFRDATLRDLPRLSVFVGANGSGKSTLFDAFSFLKDSLTQNVSTAVSRRGGFKELVSRGEAVSRQFSVPPRVSSYESWRRRETHRARSGGRGSLRAPGRDEPTRLPARGILHESPS